jgi:dTDP-4-amino-4,6-dideoxygalactose transaminase
MLTTTHSPWPNFTEEEAQAVSRVLLSNRVNYWTGTECREFEKEFAQWVGVEHAIALANGTVALEVALSALGIGPGDEVIVTPRTFIASASCIIKVGAIPVFADVDENSQNITAETIAAVLSPRTKAVICVHLAGWPCDMDPIMSLANERGLFVIEDCAQAHGARYKGRSVGSIGHISAWSFCQDKIMSTAGEGGMVTTSDPDLCSRIWSYKDHGKVWNAIPNTGNFCAFQWIHESFGSNYRMTELQAAIGRIHLKRMPQWHQQRTENAKKIAYCIHKLSGIRAPIVTHDMEHAMYKFYAFVVPKELSPGWSRDDIILELRKRGVLCYQGACPEIYLEKAFDNTGYRPTQRLPVAKKLGETSLMFLVHPSLKPAEIEQTCHQLCEVMSLATPARVDQALQHIDEEKTPFLSPA